MNKPNEDIVKWCNEVLDPEKMVVENIDACNSKPHPYIIGPTHLSRNDSMFLGSTQIRDMERKYGPMCYWKGTDGRHGKRCTLPHEQHTSERVAFMKLQRDLGNAEAAEQLMLLKETFIDEGIDGFAFIDNGYRIAPPEEPVEVDAT